MTIFFDKTGRLCYAGRWGFDVFAKMWAKMSVCVSVYKSLNVSVSVSVSVCIWVYVYECRWVYVCMCG